MVFHEHHILPVRLGGSEESSNKRILCPICHSSAHFQLFEEFGDQRDLLAANGLAGFMEKEEIIANLRLLGLSRAQERVKELWKSEEWRNKRLPQVRSLQESNQERLRELREDEEWLSSWLEKLRENIKKAHKKNHEDPSEALLENWKDFGKRSKESQSRLRAENPEWRERELRNQQVASKMGVEKRKWLRENSEDYRERIREAAKKRGEEASNTYWVNDGERSRRIPLGNPIPNGFKLGKTDKRKKKTNEEPN